MKKIVISLLALTLGVLLSVPAMAGPGSVEVTVPGDITLKMGAQVRFVPTSEIDRDFGLSDGLTDTQEAAAAGGLLHQGVFADSTRCHLTEGAGAVKDDYIRTEDRLFFNFAHDQDWDVYMMLETDTLLTSASADRTDFVKGHQSQQFGIERLNASFNLPWISSRFRGGWDARGVDIGYGGFVYADDDPGFGLVGGADGWKWEAWYIKKKETEAGYGTGSTNSVGTPDQHNTRDRTLYYAKLGHDFDSTCLEAFGMYHYNRVGGNKVDHYVTGVQGKGTYGILMPMFEAAYAFGDYESATTTIQDADIKSWGVFGDIAFNLSERVGIKKFEPHVGAYYLQGDSDPTDDDLEGWTEVTGISRFTPRFGNEQSISHDGNALLGQIEYSMFPAYYGTTNYKGGGITGTADFDNPGFKMLGAGLDAAWDKWGYTTNVMAMWFEAGEAVEAYYESPTIGLTNVKIDDFMGIEWMNEVSYKLYDSVTLKAGASFLFPGDGAEDITQALNAFSRGVAFDQGESSDDVSMRFAAEFLWFF
jgi:hypothetical protein